MDLLAIDITALPDHTVRRGDLVTLIGGDIGVDDLAAAAGTIGYEVLDKPRQPLPPGLPDGLSGRPANPPEN